MECITTFSGKINPNLIILDHTTHGMNFHFLPQSIIQGVVVHLLQLKAEMVNMNGMRECVCHYARWSTNQCLDDLASLHLMAIVAMCHLLPHVCLIMFVHWG